MSPDVIGGMRSRIVEGFGAMPSFQPPLDCFLPLLCAALTDDCATQREMALVFPADLAAAMAPGRSSESGTLLGEVAEGLEVACLTQGSLGLSALSCGGRFVLEFDGRVCAVGAGVAAFLDFDEDYLTEFFRSVWADVDASQALWRFFTMATGEQHGEDGCNEPVWPRPLPVPGPDDAVFEDVMGHPATVWKYGGFAVVSGSALMVRMEDEGPCWSWSWSPSAGLVLSFDEQTSDGSLVLASFPVDSWFYGVNSPRLGASHAGATMWFARNVPKPRMVSRALEAFVDAEMALGTKFGRAMEAAGWSGCL